MCVWGGGWGCWGHLLCDAMQHLLLVLPKIRCTRLTVQSSSIGGHIERGGDKSWLWSFFRN